MRFEYRMEKKVSKKERERERRQVVTSFKINARLSGWKAGILFYRAKPEIPVSLYKSRGKSQDLFQIQLLRYDVRRYDGNKRTRMGVETGPVECHRVTSTLTHETADETAARCFNKLFPGLPDNV